MSKKREIEACFYLHDYEDTGKISNDQLNLLMRTLGVCPTTDELPGCIKKVDPEGSGSFDLENFMNCMKDMVSSAANKQELADAFDLFDRNGDGVLTMDDMTKCAEFLKISMTMEEIKFMFEKVDTDKDGKITLADFQQLLG